MAAAATATASAQSAPTSSSSSSSLSSPSKLSSRDDNNDKDALLLLTMKTDGVPRTMSEALDMPDPTSSLLALSNASRVKAQTLSTELTKQLTEFVLTVPDILVQAAAAAATSTTRTSTLAQNPVTDATASADSILNSLTKIASGGSQASLEIRKLETEKAELELHFRDVETALALRHSCDDATTAIPSQNYDVAASAIQQYLQLRDSTNNNRRCRINQRATAYAGEYTIQQLEQHYTVLQQLLQEQYEKAVQTGDLQKLSQLTPLLPKVHMEQQAVSLYVKYLQGMTNAEFTKAIQTASNNNNNSNSGNSSKQNAPPPFTLMARVYNAAVNVVRHHLPMVAHCLYKAQGDAAIVQLVHVQVEQHVLPLFTKYIETRELPLVAQSANTIYQILEERYSGRTTTSSSAGGSGLLMGGVGTGGGGAGTDGDYGSGSGGGGGGGMAHDSDLDDCGFAEQVGTLADVDAAMEEAALCLQHAESYTRFMNHSCNEINKARKLRFDAEQEAKRIEREREEWATGMTSSSSASTTTSSSDRKQDDDADEDRDVVYEALEILPPRTQLQEVVAEVGGYYSGIERCLLLASMQRAFVTPDTHPRYLSPLGIKGQSSNQVASRAFQTSLVETCLYAARRSTQRAFATGHTGTASAMANFASDALGGVLMTVMSQRVEELGVHALKPGEGLLVGSGGLFSNIHRHATAGAAHVTSSKHKHHHHPFEEEARRRETQMDIAKACATFNDLEIAINHTKQLESLLSDSIDKGFPAGHDTEQLRMCVKSLGPVAEGFQLASNDSIESLVAVLQSRIRNIVGQVVGPEGSGAVSANFMGSMAGGKGGDHASVKMNYDLDDDAYQMLQLIEGFIGRLCTLLDELIGPLQMYLTPRLWDALLLGVLGATCKRLETSLRKVSFCV